MSLKKNPPYRYVTVPTDVSFAYTYYWDSWREYESTNIPGNGMFYFPPDPVCFMKFEQIEVKQDDFEGWGEDLDSSVNINYKVSAFLKSIFVAFFLFLV